jgi:DNA-binding HxlR family transcriptional regulator
MACSIEDLEAALEVISGRWKPLILFHLFAADAPLRFSALERAIPKVTQKMLAQQLRALETDGLLRRSVRQVTPPHVEYELTTIGHAMRPSLEALHVWAGKYARRRRSPSSARTRCSTP